MVLKQLYGTDFENSEIASPGTTFLVLGTSSAKHPRDMPTGRLRAPACSGKLSSQSQIRP